MSKVETLPPVKIWTIQLARWRTAADRNIAVLNTTAKSGLQQFAPDIAEVMRYKRGEISEQEYTDRYMARMRESMRLHPAFWKQLHDKEEVAVACYCPRGAFCHRHIFARDVMRPYLEHHGRVVEPMGELVPLEKQ